MKQNTMKITLPIDYLSLDAGWKWHAYWEKFVVSIFQIHVIKPSDCKFEILNRALSKYNAFLDDTLGNRSFQPYGLVFDSEEDRLEFLLTYS